MDEGRRERTVQAIRIVRQVIGRRKVLGPVGQAMSALAAFAEEAVGMDPEAYMYPITAFVSPVTEKTMTAVFNEAMSVARLELLDGKGARILVQTHRRTDAGNDNK